MITTCSPCMIKGSWMRNIKCKHPRRMWNLTRARPGFVSPNQVLHAALAGHAALEQSFYLPVEAMATPSTSPLRVLEGLTGRAWYRADISREGRTSQAPART